MFIDCYHKIHKDQKVQGFLDYNSCAELENIIQYNVSEVLEDNDIIYNNEIEYLCIYAHGSRVFGNPRKNSDIDFVLFYKGSIREDDLFNIFADENIYIEHVKCDFNPIQIGDNSDIEYYIQKHDIEYHQKLILEKKINLAFALDDFEDNEEIQGQANSKIKYKDGTKEYLDLMNEVVDLGLPSGTIWCKYNLDVIPKQLTKAEDWYGGYYAWGELEPNKPKYDWNSYKFGNVYRGRLTKYCNSPRYGFNGFIDNLTELQLEDDAAYQNKHLYNYKFHIPSKEQCEELIKYTKNYWIKNYNPNKVKHNLKNDGGIKGLNGRIFEGKNGNQLFIPAAGCRSDFDIDFAGSYCVLWSLNLYLDNDSPDSAYYLCIGSDNSSIYANYRYFGYSIRPVINL